MGNHLVSNSAAAINASDDISTVDPDESILSLAKGPRRRQHDDEDSEFLGEDDTESLASHQIDGAAQVLKTEEEKELPLHACAYVGEVRQIGRHILKIQQILWHPQP